MKTDMYSLEGRAGEEEEDEGKYQRKQTSLRKGDRNERLRGGRREMKEEGCYGGERQRETWYCQEVFIQRSLWKRKCMLISAYFSSMLSSFLGGIQLNAVIFSQSIMVIDLAVYVDVEEWRCLSLSVLLSLSSIFSLSLSLNAVPVFFFHINVNRTLSFCFTVSLSCSLSCNVDLSHTNHSHRFLSPSFSRLQFLSIPLSPAVSPLFLSL